MIVEKAYGEYSDFRIPGMVATDKGTLLRYCECRRSIGDWADIDLKISRSDDGGESWTTVLLIESGGITLNNPVMFVDRERLVLLYCKNYREIWKRVSTDDGRSFGEAERVGFEHSVDFFYNAVALGPGHGIVHRQRLIVPIWFAYNHSSARSHHPSFISTLYSEDGGESWRVGEIIFKDGLKDPSECALAVNADVEVLISIRHEGEIRTRALAKSSDGISAYRELRFEENLADPICMGSMTHKNGRIYHSNCDSRTKRINLSIKISDDCFESYRAIYVSELGGYSDVAIFGDRLFILYESTAPEADNEVRPESFKLFFEAYDLGSES